LRWQDERLFPTFYVSGHLCHGCSLNERILLANLLQSSRSTFSRGNFLSFFAFQEGMLDTQISARGGWPTVSERFLRVLTTIYLQRRYHSSVRNFSDVPGKPTAHACTSCQCANTVWSDLAQCLLWRTEGSRRYLHGCQDSSKHRPRLAGVSAKVRASWLLHRGVAKAPLCCKVSLRQNSTI
jgi:hypothetical protein